MVKLVVLSARLLSRTCPNNSDHTPVSSRGPFIALRIKLEISIKWLFLSLTKTPEFTFLYCPLDGFLAVQDIVV